MLKVGGDAAQGLGSATLGEAFSAGYSGEPIILLRDDALWLRETSILVRLGAGHPRSLTARNWLCEHLAKTLRRYVQRESRYCITTMPSRCDQEREHTFVSFTRSLSDALGIEFVNDRFLERRPRRDVTQVVREDRYLSLRDNWYFDGSLAGRTVILLDDVINSGSSLRAAGQCLTDAGATVIPIALMWSLDEEAETERVLRKHFEGRWEELLALPDVWGSLRESIEAWATGCPAEYGDGGARTEDR